MPTTPPPLPPPAGPLAPSAQALLRQENVLGVDGTRVSLALWREPWGLGYRLECRRGTASLVRYESALAGGHRRTVSGRAEPYAFRSVEQLRYDFERDLEGAGR